MLHFIRSSKSIYRHLIAFNSYRYRIHTECIKFGIIWLFTKLKCGEWWMVNGELNGADILMIVCALGIFLHLYFCWMRKERCQQQRPFYHWLRIGVSVYTVQRTCVYVCLFLTRLLKSLYISFVIQMWQTHAQIMKWKRRRNENLRGSKVWRTVWRNLNWEFSSSLKK